MAGPFFGCILYEQKVIMYNVTDEPTNLKIEWKVSGEKTQMDIFM